MLRNIILIAWFYAIAIIPYTKFLFLLFAAWGISKIVLRVILAVVQVHEAERVVLYDSCAT